MVRFVHVRDTMPGMRFQCLCSGGWETASAPGAGFSGHLPSGAVLTAFRRLLVLRALRPDRVWAAAERLVNEVLGADFLSLADFDLTKLVQTVSEVCVDVCGEAVVVAGWVGGSGWVLRSL